MGSDGFYKSPREDSDVFFDAFTRECGADRSFCYRSGLFTYEEVLTADGRFVLGGVNTAGYPLDVLTNFPSRVDPTKFERPEVFSFGFENASAFRWRFVSFHTEEGENNEGKKSLFCTLILTDESSALRLEVSTVADGTKALLRSYTLHNLTESPLPVTEMRLLGGGLDAWRSDEDFLTAIPEPSSVYSVGYFSDDAHNREGNLTFTPLSEENGGRLSVPCRYGAGRYRHPAAFLRNSLSGDMLFWQIGYSGGCSFDFYNGVDNYNSSPFSSSLEYGLSVTAPAPLTVLLPRESVTLPFVSFGGVHGGLDEAVNAIHSHLRRSVFEPLRKGTPAVGFGMGAEHDMSVETTKCFMRQAADLGAEVFIIDGGWQTAPGTEASGWYYQNGKNVPNAERYPLGSFDGLRDYCHSLGMKFGLWIEIERIGKESGIGQKHPDWFGFNADGTRPDKGMIDLTNSEAFDWCFSELCRMIEDFRLDLLRVDYNTSVSELFRSRDLGTGISETLSFRHTQRVYELYGALRKKYPDVIFENCAGGGGRTDLGMMSFFDHTWVSDNQMMPRSLEITNGMTCVLPPERVDRLFAGMGCHRRGSIEAQLYNTILGHVSLNVIAPAHAKPNREVADFVRETVSLYKNFIRPILPGCRTFHPTPTREEVDLFGYRTLEILSADSGRGAMTVFAAENLPEGFSGFIPLSGLDFPKTYRVTVHPDRQSFEATGYDLCARGVFVRLPSSLSAALVTFETVD